MLMSQLVILSQPAAARMMVFLFFLEKLQISIADTWGLLGVVRGQPTRQQEK